MGRKCIPGIMCVENMTLFLVFFFLLILTYFYVQYIKLYQEKGNTKIIIVSPSSLPNPNPNTPLASLTMPPLRTDDSYFLNPNINVQTRATNREYQQIGILTRMNNKHNSSKPSNEMILPLMGRRNMSGRDKWQYYTMTATGNLNTKLPVSVNGKSCTGEYGCDNINNGDTIYVEGYNDTFKATIYENNLFNYIPF
jgi:hypothetical protein